MSQEPISGNPPISNPDSSLNRRDPTEVVSDPRKAEDFKKKIQEKEHATPQEEPEVVEEELSQTDIFTTLDAESKESLGQIDTDGMLENSLKDGTSLTDLLGTDVLSEDTVQIDDSLKETSHIPMKDESATTQVIQVETEGSKENISITLPEKTSEESLEDHTSDTDTQDALLKNASNQQTGSQSYTQIKSTNLKNQPTIFDLEKDKHAQQVKNITKDTSSLKSIITAGPKFSDIPVILNVSHDQIIDIDSRGVAGVGKTTTVQPIEQITNIIVKAVETLAVRQVGGTTEVSMTLAHSEVPNEFAGASLVVTHESNRLEIRFDNFASQDHMQDAEKMIRSELAILLASLSTKQMGVQNIYIGSQEVKLPEPYVAHIATMQTNMTLEELMFGKKQNKDSSDSLDNFKRSQQGKGAQNIHEPEGHSQL